MKEAKTLPKLIAALLCVCICVSLLPVNAFAYNESFKSQTHDIFSRKTSNIAPGVTQDVCFAYSRDGKQMAYYVATADISREDVMVQSSYLNAQCTEYGMSKLTEQMTAADTKYSDPSNEQYISQYYKAVAGVNADFYNMTTGQPSGAFVMDGIMSSNKTNERPFFAIMADGTALCGANNEQWDAAVEAHGEVKQAVGGNEMLVVNGEDVTASATGSYNTDRHSRTMVGVTSDGKVVMAVLDGRQEPFSCGGTMHELAQIMLEAGCVSAINLDGGGSTTFAARQEGEESVTIVNRPSDGSARSISSGLIIATTATPSNAFDHAVLSAESEYVTPGASVKVSAVGVSASGTSAAVPADATYTATLGTIQADGVFVSDGTVGDAVINILNNGVICGQTVIHVVIPEKITFDQTEITIPYGATSSVSFTASYGLNQVTIEPRDISLTLDDEEAATVDGFELTACEESTGIKGTKIKAKLNCNEAIEAEAELVFGKGSDVIMDFENGELPVEWSISTGYPQYGPAGANGQNEKGILEIVNATNGRVHSGNNALAVNVDMSQLYETGFHLLNFSFGSASFQIPANATAFGFWLYVPEDTEGIYARCLVDTDANNSGDYTPEFLPIGLASTYEEAGWHYYSMDMTKYATEANFFTVQIYIQDRDSSTYNYYFKNQYSIDSKFTLYLDDITIDYSSVVEDRESPIFSNICYADGSMSDAVELSGQTVADSVVSFAAKVREDTEKKNYSGLDASTASAYIDGVKTRCTYSGGLLSVQDAQLADGVHTISFEIMDKMGNAARISRKITIAANSGLPYVQLIPTTPDATKIKIGSLQYYELKTNAIANINEVNMVLNLNSVSNWELQGMTVADGFTAEYSIDKVTNDASITIKKTSEVNSTDTILASIPVRTWVSTITNDPGYETSTPESLWKRKIIWPKDIKLSVDYGLVKLTDGETTFGSPRYQTITELYGNYAALKANGDYSNKSSWHVHNVVELPDKEATCTSIGISGRTYCEECGSVVDWGVTTSATGHSYELVDGIMKCVNCGEPLSGSYDDKCYENGELVSDGWMEEGYYIDGTKLTGAWYIDDELCYFDENGKYIADQDYTGLVKCIDSEKLFYVVHGEKRRGWTYIDGDCYFFRWKTYEAIMDGEVEIDGHTYEFKDGKLYNGEWVRNEQGLRYIWAGTWRKNEWFTLRDKTYRFRGFYACTGVSVMPESSGSTNKVAYVFDENGVWLKDTNGLYEDNGELYYCENGMALAAGLVKIENSYYYFGLSYKAVRGGNFELPEAKMNGLLPGGVYKFNDDGTLAIKNGIVEENGSLYYYEDNNKVQKGLVNQDGAYYFFGLSYKAVKDGKFELPEAKMNGLLPGGVYTFDANCKMVFKEGIVEENGNLYYYENNNKVQKGLVKQDNYYYYFGLSYKAVKGGNFELPEAKMNGLLPGGVYPFDTNGRMVFKEGVIEENGNLYYYENNKKVQKGLVEQDGAYYYFGLSYKAVKGGNFELPEAKMNGLLPGGVYKFDTTGKMVR